MKYVTSSAGSSMPRCSMGLNDGLSWKGTCGHTSKAVVRPLHKCHKGSRLACASCLILVFSHAAPYLAKDEASKEVVHKHTHGDLHASNKKECCRASTCTHVAVTRLM